MNKSTKRGLLRLGIVALPLWLVGLTVIVTNEYLTYQNSMFVEVTRYPPRIPMSDISAYRDSLRKELIGNNIDSGKLERKKTLKYDAVIEEMLDERNNKIDKVLEIEPKKKQPFTEDYMREISSRTYVPMQIVKKNPAKAEKLFRLVELQRDMVTSPILQLQIGDTPPPKRRVVLVNYLFFAFALPSFVLMLGAFTIITIRWIIRGFQAEE